MKKISKDASLSVIYINHSIRATTITMLDKAGVESRHIMSVSGHRAESSIRSYSKTSTNMKRKISATLSVGAGVPMMPPPKKSCFEFGNVHKVLESAADSEERDQSPDARPLQPISNIQNINNTSSPGMCTSAGNTFYSNCTFNFGKE